MKRVHRFEQYRSYGMEVAIKLVSMLQLVSTGRDAIKKVDKGNASVVSSSMSRGIVCSEVA